MLSLAFTEKVTVPLTTDPAAGDVKATLGGVASPWGLETENVMSPRFTLLEVSRTSPVRVWRPPVKVRVLSDCVYGDAVTSTPNGTPSIRKRTPATPTLSVAFTVTAIVPETVLLPTGVMKLNNGGVVSSTVLPTMNVML